MQIEHSSNFLMQIRFTSNSLKSLKTNHFKHKSICTFLSIISKINYSNILQIEREFENKPKIVSLIPIFGISISMRAFLLKYNENHILVGYSRSYIFSRNWNHLIWITQTQVTAFQCQTSRYAQLTGSPTVFFDFWGLNSINW